MEACVATTGIAVNWLPDAAEPRESERTSVNDASGPACLATFGEYLGGRIDYAHRHLTRDYGDLIRTRNSRYMQASTLNIRFSSVNMVLVCGRMAVRST